MILFLSWFIMITVWPRPILVFCEIVCGNRRATVPGCQGLLSALFSRYNKETPKHSGIKKTVYFSCNRGRWSSGWDISAYEMTQGPRFPPYYGSTTSHMIEAGLLPHL